MSPIGLSLQEEPTNLAEAEYSSKNLDHLGIVAEMCREIGLADEIDRALGVDSRQKVTCGEAVVAMVLKTSLSLPRVHGDKACRDLDTRRAESRGLQ
jgi:hypothetical protein